MKALADPDDLLAAGDLADGLAAIRREFAVPDAFPPAVLSAAETAARRVPAEHVDRTALPFVTLDPAGSTDLDQAFAIEASGGDLLLRYAIADVAWFVADGDPLDGEAWRRGETLYLPDGKAGLYPPVLSEGAASLLPDGTRPAVIFTVRVAADGAVALDGVERAIVRSRAKLAYATVRDEDLPSGFAELARRTAAAEAARGASRIDPPAQEVEATGDGRFSLAFRPMPPAETQNAALSLAANLAVADALLAHRTGLFRVMPGPDAAAVARLRREAAALGIAWPAEVALPERERTLDPANAREAAFMLAIRRAGGGASYAPYRDGVVPWHAAMAATYVHATAPLRRLADRYVIRAALAVANGRVVPDEVTVAFERLPPAMARADATQGRIDRAVIDLAEAAMLRPHVGETFAAVVIEADDHGARIRLVDRPVVARLAGRGLAPGDRVDVRLVAADPLARTLRFERAG